MASDLGFGPNAFALGLAGTVIGVGVVLVVRRWLPRDDGGRKWHALDQQYRMRVYVFRALAPVTGVLICIVALTEGWDLARAWRPLVLGTASAGIASYLWLFATSIRGGARGCKEALLAWNYPYAAHAMQFPLCTGALGFALGSR